MLESILARLFTFVIVCAVLAASVVFGGYLYLESKLEKQYTFEENQYVFIPKGSSASAAASILSESGIIDKNRASTSFFPPRDSLILQVAAKLDMIPVKIIPGEFNFPKEFKLGEVFNILSDNKNLINHSITFPEGWRSEQIFAKLDDSELLIGDLPDVAIEGRYLPDTWFFEREESRVSILERMHKAQTDYIDELWETRQPNLPLKNKYELIILASIVEKETAIAEELPHVASVYINRLKKGMKLDADPTVAYGAGKHDGEPLLRSDLQDRSNPYNTYLYKGLPPTPIGNPGKAAIAATLNPKQTNDFYFVADGKGGHIFAQNYEQHKQNVAKWRQIEKDRLNNNN